MILLKRALPTYFLARNCNRNVVVVAAERAAASILLINYYYEYHLCYD
jgi:hypothetical protein